MRDEEDDPGAEASGAGGECGAGGGAEEGADQERAPKHLRYLGPESALLTWKFEVKRDAAQDADRLEELRGRAEWENSAGSAENEGPVTVCTRCRQDIAPPGRRRCDVCRSRHTFYMRKWRSPWRRQQANEIEAWRRAANVEVYRARDREKTREARVIRDRDREIERLEAKLTQALEVMRLARTIEDQEEVRLMRTTYRYSKATGKMVHEVRRSGPGMPIMLWEIAGPRTRRSRRSTAP